MTVEWLDAWLWPEGEQMRWWIAADTRRLSRQDPALLLQQINSPSASVRLHLTEDVPIEMQRAVHEAVSASPTRRDRWQVIFDVPRTATPPVLPSSTKVTIADLWPDAEQWPDAELQSAARALTPDSVPALQALLERLTWQCYLQDGDLEGAVDALHEALDLVLGRPMAETGRYLEQFQALRRAAGEKLAGLPEPLHQRVMTSWGAMLEPREAAERALLLAAKPSDVTRLVKQGMLPL